MKCKLETISPIHIGNGEEISPIEYIIENKKYYRINTNSLFADKDFDSNEFTNFIENYVDVKQTPYIKNFNEELAKKNTEYQLETKIKIDDSRPPQIKEFIKTSNNAFIPGSSIKGSILSALYWHILKEFSEKNTENLEIIKACLTKNWNFLRTKQNNNNFRHYIASNRRGEIQADDTIMNIVFENLIKKEKIHYYIKENRRGEIKNLIKFAPWLQITDTDLVSENNLYLGYCKVLGTARMIPIYYELLKNSIIFNFEMSILHSIFSEEEILDICDRFYSKVLEKDIKWYQDKHLSVDYESIQDQKYKVRLGQGSSSLSMSLIILAEDLEILPEYLEYWRIAKLPEGPKTRKLIIEDNDVNFPLGWAKINP